MPNVDMLNLQFADALPEEVLAYFLSQHAGGRIALASSLGLEDQILTDMMLKIDPKARIFTLDTGRLFPETYQLIDKTNLTYGILMEVYFPDYLAVEEMVNSKGMNLFYDSIEHRKLCCKVRKTDPLKRAFETLDVWVCGLRREQSITRRDLRLFEWDDLHGKLKINPLISWTEEQVWEYIRCNGVPYNRLHEQGFPSIGCQPCTRPVKDGEDIRAGRWWWEDPKHKECGLHQKE